MDNSAFPISADQLYALAPIDMPSYRDIRYDGDGIALHIDSLTPEDRAIVELLYQRLGDLLSQLRSHRDAPDQTLEQLSAYGSSVDWAGLISQVRGLGDTAHEDPTRAKVFHDLRGGGFMALSVYLQMIRLGMVRSEDTHRMFNLTRDQLKIMRNSVRGIDPVGFERDRDHRLHDVNLLLEKWGGDDHRLQDARAEILVDCRFHGAVSERCLEFSALDRVLYNLVNNATAHSADRKVYISIMPLGEHPESLRFVIFNRADDSQRLRIIGRFPAGPGQLFRGGFTTGGSGLGMRICADFVCNAYGLPTVDAALAGGYLGARFLDDHFVAWFHWPVAAE